MGGFYSEQKRKAKCPLFEGVVKSANNKITGIQCNCLGPGQSAHMILRLHGFNDMMRHKRQYCDSVDGYKKCRCYKNHEKLCE